MNLRSSRSALLALGIGAALAAGLVPAVSAAQTPPQRLPANPPPNRTAPPPLERDGARGFDRRADRFEDRLERRLDFLRSELRINPSQEQAWAAFADAVRRDAEMDRDQVRDRRGVARGGPEAGIVERLERRQQRLAEQSAHYERLLSALRPLYATLNEDQRRAADENLFSPGRDDRGRRGPRRYGMNGEFGRGFYRPFERSFGPFDPPYDSFDRSYR